MKYIMTLFWSLILGHVVYYLGSSLTGALPPGAYDIVPGTVLGIAITLCVVVVARIIEQVDSDEDVKI